MDRKIILTKVLLKVRPEEKNYSGKVAEAWRGTGGSLCRCSEGKGTLYNRGKERKWLEMELQEWVRAQIREVFYTNSVPYPKSNENPYGVFETVVWNIHMCVV